MADTAKVIQQGTTQPASTKNTKVSGVAAKTEITIDARPFSLGERVPYPFTAITCMGSGINWRNKAYCKRIMPDLCLIQEEVTGVTAKSISIPSVLRAGQLELVNVSCVTNVSDVI